MKGKSSKSVVGIMCRSALNAHPGWSRVGKHPFRPHNKYYDLRYLRSTGRSLYYLNGKEGVPLMAHISE